MMIFELAKTLNVGPAIECSLRQSLAESDVDESADSADHGVVVLLVRIQLSHGRAHLRQFSVVGNKGDILRAFAVPSASDLRYTL